MSRFRYISTPEKYGIQYLRSNLAHLITRKIHHSKKMLRLIVLVATLATVAQSTTLLYPSSYRQVAWPVQSYQYSNYYPYSTVYRYPVQVQVPYQYIQQTPYYTQTRTLIWGRSFGEQASTAAPSQLSPSSTPYVPQVNQYAVAPVAPAAPVAPVSQPSSFASQQAYVGQTGFVNQPVPAPVSSFAQPPVHAGHFVSHLSASVQPQQSYASPRSSHETPAYQVSPAYPQYSAAVQPAVVGQPQPGQAVVSFIPTRAIAEPVSAHPQSVPVAYSVDYPRPQVVSPAAVAVQPSTAHIAQIPLQPSFVHSGQPQQPAVGQHQVTQVSIPGQVGVGGGYSSATFYETAPASVVIPNVPFTPSEPIVAANVNSVASKATDGQTVQSQVQSHVQPTQNLRVQTY